MNTAGSSSDAKAAGGYGNVEFNGLPATSNGYILDGYDSNDPWLGLNIGLSTNLVIGLDAVQEATVTPTRFPSIRAATALAQVNYFTKSGTNSVSRRRSTRYGTARCSMRKIIFSTPTTRRGTSPKSRARW
jgi:hypothetical protein